MVKIKLQLALLPSETGGENYIYSLALVTIKENIKRNKSQPTIKENIQRNRF